jgi:hypothetical protein
VAPGLQDSLAMLHQAKLHLAGTELAVQLHNLICTTLLQMAAVIWQFGCPHGQLSRAATVAASCRHIV